MASKNFLDTLTPTQRIVAGVLILIIGGIAALLRIQQEKHAPPGGPTGDNRNVRFGTPAPAERDPNSRDAYLIERPQYTLSYNDTKRTANWVCWNLTKGDIGNTPRLSHFDPDPELPGSFRKVKHDDYNRQRVRPRPPVPLEGPHRQRGQQRGHVLHDQHRPPVAGVQPGRVGAVRVTLPRPHPGRQRTAHRGRPARHRRHRRERPARHHRGREGERAERDLEGGAGGPGRKRPPRPR